MVARFDDGGLATIRAAKPAFEHHRKGNPHLVTAKQGAGLAMSGANPVSQGVANTQWAAGAGREKPLDHADAYGKPYQTDGKLSELVVSNAERIRKHYGGADDQSPFAKQQQGCKAEAGHCVLVRELVHGGSGGGGMALGPRPTGTEYGQPANLLPPKKHNYPRLHGIT